MSSPFRIVNHVVECQHIREYPGATANEQEEPLKLAVKQYIPLNNPSPQPGDVTILAAHANGFPKVCSSEFETNPFDRIHPVVTVSFIINFWNRNYTNLFGGKSMLGPKKLDSAFEASGWPTSPGKEKAA
ncbi:uncharacterized protein N7477_008395 [Penicillium maclennaniae]|uniref:uncharacterized protein n=1 Tax=Penicillium maclennaniae TaxID=1343394 RepID=UPI0025400019|nr:uncharacterized protein N7477_008395 [Penicillium maclennaniae]KAJ5665947.1 hypothetical protein N7477_008395 [Penicillium maclennaniae]